MNSWRDAWLTRPRRDDQFDRYVEDGWHLIEQHPDFEAMVQENEDDDVGSVLETIASDQIATILHGVYGRTPHAHCMEDAYALLEKASRCWDGDYEDIDAP